MPTTQKRLINSIPDFDVLHESPMECAEYVKNKLHATDIKYPIKIIKRKGLDEIIPEHLEIRVGKDTIAFIYEPIACHNYNKIVLTDEPNKPEIHIATIDTMLSFYLAFLYSKALYYYKDRILCMAKFLFEVEQKNRLEQNGLLKRFSIDCYGKQPTLESIRAKKAEMFKRLSKSKYTEEYQRWFLKYIPSEKNGKPKMISNKKKKYSKYWWKKKNGFMRKTKKRSNDSFFK
jgi:hypothetical protein